MVKRKSEEERIKERILYHEKRIEVYKKAKGLLHKLINSEDIDKETFEVLFALDRVLDGWILSARVAINILESELAMLEIMKYSTKRNAVR